MGKLKVELDVFSNEDATFDEEGNAYPTKSLEEAIIAVAANKLLGIDVPDESEKGYHRADKVRELLTKRIEAAVSARVEAFTFDQVDVEVRKVIDEGWKRTDEYGTPVGEKLTLKDRVSQILNSRKDNYKRETRVEELAREAIETALKKVFDAEIEKARISFRAQIDGVLQAKLRESLAGALGLKA